MVTNAWAVMKRDGNRLDMHTFKPKNIPLQLYSSIPLLALHTRIEQKCDLLNDLRTSPAERTRAKRETLEDLQKNLCLFPRKPKTVDELYQAAAGTYCLGEQTAANCGVDG